MRVLVCGSRGWNDRKSGWLINVTLTGLHQEFSEGLLHPEDPVEFVLMEGGSGGADADAAKWADLSPFHSGYAHHPYADKLRFEHLQFKAEWDHYGKGAGHIRNQRMLDEGKPDLVLAFKDNFDWTLAKGGTEDMVRRAKAAGVPTFVIQRAV